MASSEAIDAFTKEQREFLSAYNEFLETYSDAVEEVAALSSPPSLRIEQPTQSPQGVRQTSQTHAEIPKSALTEAKGDSVHGVKAPQSMKIFDGLQENVLDEEEIAVSGLEDAEMSNHYSGGRDDKSVRSSMSSDVARSHVWDAFESSCDNESGEVVQETFVLGADDKRERNKSYTHVTQGNDTGSQSTIFSPRWRDVSLRNADELVSSYSSPAVGAHLALKLPTPEMLDFFRPLNLKNILLRKGSTEVFSKVRKVLKMEDVSLQCLEYTLVELGEREQNFDFAPSCARLKRRLLHRPSQETTQTEAAPLSALEWISRHAKHGNMEPTVTNFEHYFSVLDHSEWSPLAFRKFEECSTLNSHVFLSGCKQNRMTDAFEVPRAFINFLPNQLAHELRMILSLKGDDANSLIQHENGTFGDFFCRVASMKEAREIANLLRRRKSSGLTWQALSSGPLVGRLIGAWEYMGELSGFVLMDIKFVLSSHPARWAVEDFFKRPFDQVSDITRWMSSKFTLDPLSVSLPLFLKGLLMLQSQCEGEITNWDQILDLYSSDDS